MNMNRIEAGAHCVMVACDRSLCRRGNPMLSNLEAVAALKRLGFVVVAYRRAPGGGEWLYAHPRCRFGVLYVEYRCADGMYWALERRSVPSDAF